MRGWDADVTTDRRFGDALCVELTENGEPRATVRRAPDGGLVMEVFRSKKSYEVPAEWLVGILTRADRELPEEHNGDGET